MGHWLWPMTHWPISISAANSTTDSMVRYIARAVAGDAVSLAHANQLSLQRLSISNTANVQNINLMSSFRHCYGAITDDDEGGDDGDVDDDDICSYVLGLQRIIRIISNTVKNSSRIGLSYIFQWRLSDNISTTLRMLLHIRWLKNVPLDKM